MKKIEGVYRVEMLGPYGWERFSTGFVQNGHYRGASAYHYTVGSYKVEGKNFNMVGNVSQHGEQRAIFGLTDIKDLQVEFKGTIEKNTIAGEMSPKDDKKYAIHFRFTKLSDLD